MGLVIYNLFLWVFKALLMIGSLFNTKARKWVNGRKQIFSKLETSIPRGTKLIWMHCASLGEFEQGRPVIEELRKQFPSYRILLSFFSPSGYEHAKDYAGADWVFYMPLDGPSNARKFLEITRPSLVIFIKYEFWYYYLKKTSYRNIPLLLVSAQFRSDMSFFKWHGSLQRKMLSRFDHLFVQNSSSKQLLAEIGLGRITSVSGDTRFDRVVRIAQESTGLPFIEKFIGEARVLVAGSTWPADEIVLREISEHPGLTQLKFIIAPHEIGQKRLEELKQAYPGSVFYSEIGNQELNSARFLIVDNIGMLSRLYKYGTVCYVGGGMNKSGVHNVLEAAVYNKPVFFGPHYQGYTEAIGLVNSGGGIPVTNQNEFAEQLIKLFDNRDALEKTGKNAGEFVRSQTGATAIIIRYIQEKRLLTS